jgi:cytochrome c oxidase assembly factor CtaG
VSVVRSLSQLLPAAVAGGLYARRARALASERRPVPRLRQISFYCGLLTVAVAILALDHVAAVSLSWRIAQLFLIGDVATLLLVLGVNAALIAPVLRTRTANRMLVLTTPPIAFALWIANLYLWLLSPLYSASLEYDGIRALQDLCFVVFGINMWICLLGPFPKPRWFSNTATLFYILAVRVGAVVLANLFLWSGKVFSSYYTRPDSARHTSPLVDQNVAGVIMLVESVVLTLGLFCWLYQRTLREAEEPARVFDFEREFVRELSRTPPRPRRRAAAPQAAGRRRRFQPEAERPATVPQREVLDSS